MSLELVCQGGRGERPLAFEKGILSNCLLQPPITLARNTNRSWRCRPRPLFRGVYMDMRVWRNLKGFGGSGGAARAEVKGLRGSRQGTRTTWTVAHHRHRLSLFQS